MARPHHDSPKPLRVASVTPFLWFNEGAAEAARFYVSLFADSRVDRTDAMSAEFTLAGRQFYALNGGPAYKLSPAYSMFVQVETQDEVDHLWAALLAGGGREDRCGWLVDRFGLSWQVIPRRLGELLRHKDPEVAQRALQSMLTMQRIDIARLEADAKAPTTGAT